MKQLDDRVDTRPNVYDDVFRTGDRGERTRVGEGEGSVMTVQITLDKL